MRKILEHSFTNILGQAIPMVVGLFMVPLLINQIGTELFGTLTLVWVFIGYFSLFDLGLGRAITYLTVEYSEKQEFSQARRVFWFSIRWMGIIGFVAALILSSASDWITQHWLTLSPQLQKDVALTIGILAFAIPLVAWQGALRGFLEAHFRFKVLNITQAISGIYTFVSPFLAWKIHSSLSSIVCLLFFGRLINVIYLWFYIFQHWSWIFKKEQKLEIIKVSSRIIQMSGWFTVSNIIGPIMVYFDRFILGSFIPMGELAYYTTPYEFVSRLSILPASLVRVLFPEFSKPSQKNSIPNLYYSSLKVLSVLMAIPCGLIILFSREGLLLWLGEGFAQKSTLITQILTLGVYYNSLALIPFTLIQGMEKSKWTAQLHLTELPFYLLFLWVGIHYWGLTGAAVVWTIRIFFDEVALSFFAPRAANQIISQIKLKLGIYGMSIFIMGIALFPTPAMLKYVTALILMIGAIHLVWKNRRIFLR